MIAPRWTRSLLTAAVGLAAIGCSGGQDNLPRQPVAGTVTVDGRPLPDGTILFAPAGALSATSTSATAKIEEGRFTIPRAEGLVPGSYKVSISRAELVQAKGKATGPLSKSTRLGKESIPTKYNSKTTLTAEIPRGGKDDLDFPLQSK